MIFKKWFVDDGGWLSVLAALIIGYLVLVFP